MFLFIASIVHDSKNLVYLTNNTEENDIMKKNKTVLLSIYILMNIVFIQILSKLKYSALQLSPRPELDYAEQSSNGEILIMTGTWTLPA